jgi:hypothetical protein
MSSLDFVSSYKIVDLTNEIQVSKGQRRRLRDDVKPKACFDLFIADMPDGLPVPNISTPRTSVPMWNLLRENWAEPIFEFARDVLQDDGAILLFYLDNPKLRASTNQSAADFRFTCLHD